MLPLALLFNFLTLKNVHIMKGKEKLIGGQLGIWEGLSLVKKTTSIISKSRLRNQTAGPQHPPVNLSETVGTTTSPGPPGRS